MKVLVTGATGFVGSRLCGALVGAGHDVRAMTRRPESYHGPGVAVAGDIERPASLSAAIRDCDAAYYLVHSLDARDFAHRDRRGAEPKLAPVAFLGTRLVDQERRPDRPQTTMAVDAGLRRSALAALADPASPDAPAPVGGLSGGGPGSAGILGGRPTIAAFHVDQRVDGLAITDEQAGGVVVSENAPVVFGRIGQG